MPKTEEPRLPLTDYLRIRLEQKKILLMTHLIVGFPSLEANWQMLEAMQAADVDLVELQMPFSEPIADGPLFVRANQSALHNGIDWQAYFSFMSEARDQFSFPLLMIGYYNSAFTMGHRSFCSRLQDYGAQGFILPDLPVEEYDDLFELSDEFGLSPIQLCAPTHTEERLQALCEHGRGFIYCVARKGVTGAQTSVESEVLHFLERCRKHTTLPLALGFGLSRGEDLRQLHNAADIAVVGSALLTSWEKGGRDAYIKHLQELSAATH
jgi:tryptophan synthase alpha chain